LFWYNPLLSCVFEDNNKHSAYLRMKIVAYKRANFLSRASSKQVVELSDFEDPHFTTKKGVTVKDSRSVNVVQ